MAEYTKNYKLEKQQGNDNISIEGLNENFDKIDTALGNSSKFEKASGTGTAIILNNIVLEDGASKAFIVSDNNNSAATTINGKKLYKSGTTTAPSLIAGKPVTVWYSMANDCFYTAGGGDADTLEGKPANSFVDKTVILPVNTDLDTVLESGFYRIMGTPQNGPASAHSSQMIVSRGSDTITQIIISWTGNKRMYYRSGNPMATGGVWGDWQEVSTVGHTHTKSSITDFPTSLPANGGNAATVNGKTVAENVPAGAKFTDTVYIHPGQHAPSILSNGALPIGVTAAGSNTDYGTYRLRNVAASTVDLTPNASALASGYIYIVYE